MKKDSILYVVAFTFVVCVAFVLILALANEGTKDLVEANREFTSQSSWQLTQRLLASRVSR